MAPEAAFLVPTQVQKLMVLGTTVVKAVAKGSKLITWNIISGVLTLMGLLRTAWIIWEIETGVAHQRGYSVIRSEDSFGFWLLTTRKVIVVGLFFYDAWTAWQQGSGEPNFLKYAGSRPCELSTQLLFWR